MAILQGDIKLVASQVMADVPNGGGAPTANIIADAVHNAIFPDISELDRAAGRVNLRKLFAHVQTSNLDGYFGANMIIAEPPTDPNVSITIFSLGDVFDRRAAAASRMEAYLNAANEIAGFLYEDHIEGQRVIQLMTRTNVAAPVVGHTYVLRKREGFSDEVTQYVRITRVSSEQRTYTDSQGDFLALVHTCDISDELNDDFPGTSANRNFLRGSTDTITRDTVVANASSFCGVVALEEAVEIGDVEIKAETIYTKLVPSAQSESPLTDQYPSQAYAVVVASSPRSVIVGGSPLSQRIRIGQENRGFNYTTILDPLPAPSSVRVVYRALGANYTLTDDGAGNLTGQGSGTVNYLTGSVVATLDALPDDRSAVMFYWGQKVAYTNRAGTPGFRMPEYSWDLEHQGVTPGSLQLTWESNSVTKTATDNGSGKITGDATGEVIYSTGLVRMRPNAMPDAGAEIEVEYTYRVLVEEALTGTSPDGTGTVAITFAQTPVAGTVQAIWLTTRETSESAGSTSTAGSTNKSQMTNSSSSNTTKTGPVMMDVEKIFDSSVITQLVPYNAPDSELANDGTVETLFNTTSSIVTVREPVIVTTSESTSGTGSESTSTGATYTTSSQQTSRSGVTVSHLITDDGAGNWFGTFGTINYVAKTANLKVRSDYSETTYQSNHEEAKEFETLNATSESTTTVGGGASTSVSSGGGGSATSKGGAFGSTTQTEVFGTNSLVIRYQVGSASPTAAVETYTPPGVSIDLCPYTTDVIVPGSVRFTWMGTIYEDYEGVIYRGRTESDPGIESGRLVYSSGLANMSDYVVSGSATSLTVQSLWTRKQREHIANVSFMTALAPIKPTGLTVSVLDVSGEQIIATANLAGEIIGTHTHGVIDYESGLVEIQFGDYVLDSSLTAAQKDEWWYDANDVRVSDGKIWRPWPVDPETLRYNTVAYFYLPIDAELLGLDPVRLPQDGRVPIFRPGGFAVLGNTQEIVDTVANSDVIDCERVRLSRVRIIGSDGNLINTGYTADLEDGTVTFTDVSGYSQPVTIEHRIEDMVMVAEAQINGRMRFTREVTHEYPVPGSYVSSAMVVGDMQSYVSLLFDQATWTGVWSDALIGSNAGATYNDVTYPIGLSNIGASTERWALVVNTGNTTFNVIGEHVGVIAVNQTFVSDCAPINPATGAAYFTLESAGWGAGWTAGMVLRFNTIGTIAPMWVVRTIQQGPETVDEDEFTLLIRGDVDRP